MSEPLKIGIALTGSFCTFHEVLTALESLKEIYDLYPIMSPIAYESNTRFGTAVDFRNRLETLCGREIWHTIPQVEPIGPKKILDALLIAPCTGNTLAKLALGVTDTAVTMAAKSTLRNERPVILALSTNDALSGAGKNIGLLQTLRNYYFVPYGQDNTLQKPRSCVAHFDLIPATIAAALEGQQLQPLLK
ncbi:MAG: dipicolinate synthase subunit B [Clostridia bacterium]|nr:dipicolinate synthase subunit B [Clostridia bacterium]